MKIGIDIDGVLNYDLEYSLDIGSKVLVEKGIDFKLDPTDYETSGIYKKGLLNNYEDDEKLLFDFAVNCPAKRHADEVTKKLRADGHTIYIITARCFSIENSERGEQMRSSVKAWLYKHNIVYDELLFRKDKDIACKENNIDVMIEDFPENIYNLHKQLPVICYDAPYNITVKGRNITRCHSWYEIYHIIKKWNHEN